ncbi:MAG TPA: SRPBCC domain-containing protein [Nitriliruptoraceae bacterium]|nr:SRPBCC domain-containing protein [Nitriliruptoraceae bacterium]
MTRRTERFHVDIAATPDQVWRMLTTAEGLASWFGTRASIDLRLDGDVEVGWGDQEAITSRITVLEPPHRLRLSYLVEGEELGAEEWLVTTSDTSTRLTLVHSMPDDDVDDWDGYYGDIRRGWRLFLASLRHALHNAAEPLRSVTSRSLPMPGDRDAIWAALTRAVGFDDDVRPRRADADAGADDDRPDSRGRPAGDELQALRTGPFGHLGLRVVLADPPHSLLLTSAEHTLLCDVEGGGDQQHLYLQAATHHGDASFNERALATLTDRLQS